jgi:hypothetical protein
MSANGLSMSALLTLFVFALVAWFLIRSRAP